MDSKDKKHIKRKVINFSISAIITLLQKWLAKRREKNNEH